jgi:hypothetical protein
MRADVDPEVEWPVLVLDVTEEEAALLLATVDPMANMAEADAEELAELLEGLDASEAEVKRLLDSLVPITGDEEEQQEKIRHEAEVRRSEMELQPHEHYDYLVVLASDSHTWNVLCEKLGIEPREYHAGRTKSRIGVCRAVRAETLLEKLKDG